MLKDSTRELKAFAKLCAQRFDCQADAQAELSRFSASLMLLQLDAEVVSEPIYAGRDRMHCSGLNKNTHTLVSLIGVNGMVAPPQNGI